MTAAPGLDWDDPTDLANATRGRLDTLTPCMIRNAEGRVVWDNERWSFLAEDCPATADPSLWRQGRLNSLHGLFEVVEGVYQIRGFDVSNMTIIEGTEGLVIVDPLISEECAAAGLALYHANRGTALPVAAVIYSHSHTDHFGGVRGVTSDADVAEGRVRIVAPEGFMEEAVSENVVAGPAMLRRAQYMYGVGLPAAPDGAIGFGLGQGTSSGKVGLIPPTDLITETGQVLELGGIRLEFQLTPGTEAPAEMNFFIPGRRVLLVAENANHTLHNVLTLRGALVRDAQAWAAYLTETITLYADRSDALIGSHHWPTWGRTELLTMLSEQRDAYAYLHDQTVRLMNQGLTGAEIAEELAAFPPQLAAAWHARGYYGSLSHNSKAVYQRYMGWFDGNPAHLWQHPPVAAAERYVEFMGGAEAVVKKARETVDSGDLRFAAEVLNHVVFADPDHREARELQAETFEKLAHACENGTWRNFYLSGARDLRDFSGQGAKTSGSGSGGGIAWGLPAGQVFKALAVRVDGPRAAEHRLVMRWEFGADDAGAPADVWTLLLANGVLTPIRGHAPGGEQPQVTVRTALDVLVGMLGRRTTLAEAVASGGAELDGDAGVLRTFFGLLQAPRAGFPLVLP
ncbi:alkyl/aryl-sulfatase [Streptomyces sp. NRRL B-24720]|uniref:alkyl/aryl-sulfatase n=1 Tax=Streptomyces sp. NRRL B-24720 TaxID=1476876 RepID=UPI000569B5F4|nr:alkyl sulfatase dimerization domain-containing protein [Streptomyces sp. NRRL B-24720]